MSMPMTLHTMLLLCTTLPLVHPDTAPPQERSALVSSRIEERVLKVFDFDEEQFGNYERMPMNWIQLTAPEHPGHPRYLEPIIDTSVGHPAPPSFKLPLAGGSLACHYLSKDISVHPACDYLVAAWVRPQGLVHARAYLTAYFLDHALQHIEESRQQSVSIRGAAHDEPWQRVTVRLRGGFENARWIGLSVHVEQAADTEENLTDPSSSAALREGRSAVAVRPIRKQDIRATAWFDDIVVLRLPSVELTVGAPGNVFEHDMPAAFRLRVADFDGRGLAGRFEVFDVDGMPLENRKVPIGALDQPDRHFELPALQTGFYTARLTVDVECHEQIIREQTFVRLSPPLPSFTGGTNGFGVSVGPSAPAHQKISDRLLRLIGAMRVKAPLWRNDMEDTEIVEGDRRADVLIRALRARGVTVIGVLAEPPPSLAQAFGHPAHTVLDVLSSSPDRWRPYLAFLLARYGHEVQAWQLGPDDVDTTASEQQLAAATSNIREVLQPLVGSPRLIAPRNASAPLPLTPLETDVLSVRVGAQISSSRLSDQLSHYLQTDSESPWVSLETLPHDRFDRRARQVETTRRIVMARFLGARNVFVAQPWTVTSEDPPRIQPDDTFGIVRTLFQALDGLSPIGEIWLDDGVRGCLFGDTADDMGVLVVWTDAEGESPRQVVTDAAPNAAHYDVLGRTLAVRRVPEGRQFNVDAMPSILMPVEVARAQTIASFHVDPPNLQVRIEPHRCKLKIKNYERSNLAGRLDLIPPEGWQVSPKRSSIQIPPGQTHEIDLTLQTPSNQASGSFVLHARLHREGQSTHNQALRTPTGRVGSSHDEPESVASPRIDQRSAERTGDLILRTPLTVETPGLDVSVLTHIETDRLHVVQRITNRTGRTLDLRGVVLYPDMRQETRLIRQLVDGQTTHRVYELDRLDELYNHPIRVSLEEVAGPIRCHRIIMVPSPSPNRSPAAMIAEQRPVLSTDRRGMPRG